MPVTDQGKLTNKYKFIPRTLIFLTCNELILLLKGSPSKRLWANLFNGVGGHIEPGEDILSAARRELREEAGIIPLNLRICGIITIDVSPEYGICIYVCKGESLHTQRFSTPEGEALWIPLSQVYDLPLVEDIPVILPLVLGNQSGDPVFSAHYRYNEQGELEINIG